MAKLIQRIGAKHLKFELKVEIHYLKIDLPEASLLQIRVKRGKDKVEETQVMQYSSKVKRVQFDYPLNFRITMYKKGNKFSKKDLSIKILEIKGKDSTILGTSRIEFHKIAETGKNIVSEELLLEGCNDAYARLCASISLYEEGKPRNDFLTGNASTADSYNRRALSFNSNDFNSETLLALKAGKESSSLLSPAPYESLKDSPKNASRNKTSYSKKDLSPIEKQEDLTGIDDKVGKQDRDRKASIKKLRSAFAISQEVIDAIDTRAQGPEKNQDAKTVENKQLNDIEEETENIENNVMIKDLNETKEYASKVGYNSKSAKNSPDKIIFEEKPNEPITISDEEKSLETETKTQNSIKIDSQTEKITDSEIPEYLKFENQHISAQIDKLSKDSDDSSSSEELPVEVIQDLPLPITDLKASIANSSSQDAQLTLKEREAGLPSSREALCCSGCQIY